MAATSAAREAKLQQRFNDVLQGKQELNSQNGPLFLEAICVAPDTSACISKILGCSKGLSYLQMAMRYDFSPKFLNGLASKLLRRLDSSGVATAGNGSFLAPVIVAIAEPPIIWGQFLSSLRAGQLNDDGVYAFAWLLLQVVLLPDSQAPASQQQDVAHDDDVMDILLSSTVSDAKALAQKIKSLVSDTSAPAPNALQDGPGGRHDNDFVDYHDIAVLPTFDELQSKKKPFLRLSSFLDDPVTVEHRVFLHLDNQFRLLREDMVYEMRDELDIIFGRKKGKRRGFYVPALTLTDLRYKSADRNGKERSCKCSLTFTCRDDFSFLKNVQSKKRKKHLEENKSVFKHQSMSCLVADGNIIAFPTIFRDEDLLAKQPPVIVLEFDDQASMENTLLRLPRAKNVQLYQINTAVFSYEPVLLALKEKKGLSLSRELLLWENMQTSSALPPPGCPHDIVNTIRYKPTQDLRNLLGVSKSIILDSAQAKSLISALSQRVSLIQGPPGES